MKNKTEIKYIIYKINTQQYYDAKHIIGEPATFSNYVESSYLYDTYKQAEKDIKNSPDEFMFCTILPIYLKYLR